MTEPTTEQVAEVIHAHECNRECRRGSRDEDAAAAAAVHALYAPVLAERDEARAEMERRGRAIAHTNAAGTEEVDRLRAEVLRLRAQVRRVEALAEGWYQPGPQRIRSWQHLAIEGCGRRLRAALAGPDGKGEQ